MKKILLSFLFLFNISYSGQTTVSQEETSHILNNGLQGTPSFTPSISLKSKKPTLVKVIDGITILTDIVTLALGGFLILGAIEEGKGKTGGIGFSFMATSINNLIKTHATYKDIKSNEHRTILPFIKDVTITCLSLVSIICIWKREIEGMNTRRSSVKLDIIIPTIIVTSTVARLLWHTVQEGKKVYKRTKISKS